MTQIDFHFNVGSRLLYACRFVSKVRKLGKTIAVWSSDTERLSEFDSLLWTFEDLSFIPHAPAGSSAAEGCPVLLSPYPGKLPDSDVLLLLDEDVPPDFEQLFRRFERIADIVSSVPEETAAARRRYKIYHQLNYPLRAFDQGRH